MTKILLSILLATVLLASCKKETTKEPDITIFSKAGDINATIDSFRQLLGPLNTSIGQTTGRREINWDGLPDSLVGKKLSDDLFNPTGAGANPALQRGLAYAAGGEFQISNNNFSTINAEAAGQFSAFSGNKSFANVSAALWGVGFQVAGQVVKASVKGFGIVFSDVDETNSTSIEFFEGTKSLGKYFVPPHNTIGSFSFLGVYFSNNEITHVQVSHKGFLLGGGKDVSDGGVNDLVILDDFIYGEPHKWIE